jgi:RND family efflux transporter MFP subunit
MHMHICRYFATMRAMNLTTIRSNAAAYGYTFISFFDLRNKTNRRRALVAWGVLIVLAIIVYRIISNSHGAEAAVAESPRLVQLATVSSLASGNASLTVVGQVSANSQATLHAEKGGQVIALYKHIGDNVGAGEVIAELEHASEAAAVQQAQGAVAAARANLSKTTGGARTEQKTILESSVSSATDSLANTKISTVNTIISSYQTIENAVTTVADSMITNPNTVSPQFVVTTSNSQTPIAIQSQRTVMNALLSREHSKTSTLSPSDDLLGEIAATESDARAALTLMNSIVSGLNNAIPTSQVSASTIAGYLASASASRTQLNATLAGLSAARETYNGKVTALTVAQQNLAQGVTGGQAEDVSAGQASLQSAEGGLAAAQASYEHSIIRAPISGSITMLSLKNGDFATAFAPVATIANNAGLEVVAYVNAADLRQLSVGTKTTLDNGATGVVTRLATAVDPTSKKAEVHIGVTSQGSLTNGQSTTVSFARADVSPDSQTASATSSGDIIIPLSAVKVGSDNMSIFTLSASSTLMSHVVTIGTLLGDRVQILTGITPDMTIVIDARGLREGQKVITQ